MRIVCLLAALLLAGCGAAAAPTAARDTPIPATTVPTPATPATDATAATAAATPTPNRDSAQQVDPRRLRADMAAYAGWNVLVWGTAREVVAGAAATTLTLDAYGPNLIRQPLPVAVPSSARVGEGGCYYVYALVGAGVLQGYRVERIVAGDKIATCGT